VQGVPTVKDAARLRHTGPGRDVFEATGPVLIAAAGPGRAGPVIRLWRPDLRHDHVVLLFN